MLSANFQITYTLITCSRPIRRTGPFAALASKILSLMGILSFSALRVIEMALSATEIFPASIARLLDEASQARTSGVMHSV